MSYFENLFLEKKMLFKTSLLVKFITDIKRILWLRPKVKVTAVCFCLNS